MRRVLIVACMLAGCGPADVPCTNMMMPSDLATQAQLLRLDVYDGSLCDGSTVQAGAPAPSLSQAAGPGMPIHLDIPSGAHTLLLSAFADATGNQLLATACTETNLNAGGSVCFDLTLVEVPDLALNPDARATCSASPDDCPVGQYCAVDGQCAPGCKNAGDCMGGGVAVLCDTTAHRCVQCLGNGDCGPGTKCSPSGSCVMGCDVAAGANCPGSQMCCSNLCIDISSDISSCGACGRACSSMNVATPGCMTNLCAPVCTSGFGDCNHPVAPNADDGCETSLHDVMHCGGCNTVCSLPNATPKCPSGTCQIASCNASSFDCDGTATNGCECSGSTALGGNGCCTNKCQTAHDNGYMNGAFFDCETGISLVSATDAAITYKPSAKNTSAIFSGKYGTISAVCYVDPGNSEAVSWAYADDAGLVVGRTHHNSVGTCVVPSVTDGMWH